jgi:hypothetical protein
MSLKKFLFLSLAMVALSVITSITVWYLLQNYFSGDNNLTTSEINVPISSTGATHDAAVVEDGGIPLMDLHFSDTQKKSIEAFGIDIDTFVITEAMITCAKGKLGSERFDALIAGATLSFGESLSLSTCITAR